MVRCHSVIVAAALAGCVTVKKVETAPPAVGPAGGAGAATPTAAPTTTGEKWALHIGRTTYKTTLHVVDGKVIVGSNGDDWRAADDDADGVYVIDAANGHLIRQIVPPGGGERDVNGVALAEDGALVFGTDQGTLYKTDAAGQVLWSASLGGDVEAAPALADFDRDGVLDVAVGAEDGDFFMIDGRTGKIRYRYPTGQGDYGQGGFLAPAALFDITGDGVPEIYAPGRDGELRAIDGGQAIVRWSDRRHSGMHSAPIIVDTDGDESVEVVYAESYSTIVAAEPASGRVVWQRELEHPGGGIEGLFGPLGWHPTARCVLVATAWWGEREGVYCVGPKGVRWRYEEPRQNITSGVVVGDVDGQPGQEAVFGTESGSVIAVDSMGKRVWSYPTGGPVECTPTLADIDQDGLLEVLVASNDGTLRALETAGKAPAAVGYHRGSPRNDGVLQGR